MEETIKLEMTKAEATELRAFLDEFLVKSKQIWEEMEEDQREIEQYRAETRAVIDRLNQRGSVKCEVASSAA